MLCRQKPTDEELKNLVDVDNETNIILQQNNYQPLYLWNGRFYYNKTMRIMWFINNVILKERADTIG